MHFVACALALLVSLQPSWADEVAFEPDFTPSFTNVTTALRAHLLSTYDKVVPPYSHRRTYSNYSDAGTDVRMQLRFFKIESVNTAEGRMTFKVWLRFLWHDLRLAWNPEDRGNVTRTFFQGMSLAHPEESEIWLPECALNPPMLCTRTFAHHT